jgi:hypothetical protein
LKIRQLKPGKHNARSICAQERSQGRLTKENARRKRRAF